MRDTLRFEAHADWYQYRTLALSAWARTSRARIPQGSRGNPGRLYDRGARRSHESRKINERINE